MDDRTDKEPLRKPHVNMPLERVVFSFESEPYKNLRLILEGELTDDLLDALHSYIETQRKIVARIRDRAPIPINSKRSEVTSQ